ncbi:MAG: EscU/YscU/HrcU family type III secretion system export apparatus switch protein, partial [Gammaproteobacteria bacterium]
QPSRQRSIASTSFGKSTCLTCRDVFGYFQLTRLESSWPLRYGTFFEWSRIVEAPLSPEADLLNYAVALKYERGMNAPVCVAKGLDAIAPKIREVAEANGVPMVENPPLAR